MANGLFKSSIGGGVGAGALSSAQSQSGDTTLKTASLFQSQQKQMEENRKIIDEYYAQNQSTDQNRGGFFGGIGYTFEKLGLGFLQSIEGIWDFTAGGLADLFGAHDWAEKQMGNDWVNYGHADEWFNPSQGWQVAGDVFGGIGTSLPAIAAVAAAAAITYFSGGTLSPVAAGLIGGAVAGFGAAGTATKEAYKETGTLSGKEWGYGALSGFTEGAMEGVSDAIGFGVGSIAKNLAAGTAKEGAKAVGKQVAKSAARQTLGKAIIGGFLSEAFEEGVQELLDPVWKRITYDPNAENATFQQVAYAALIGGLSGAIMSGFDVSVRNTVSYFQGSKIDSQGGTNGVISLSEAIVEAEGINQSGNEQVDFVVNTFKELQESLTKTNGEVRTPKQKMLVGILSKANTAAPLSIVVHQNADAIIADAQTTVKRLNDIGYKTSDGKPVTVEMLTEGVTGERGTTEYRKSVSQAMRNNEALRTVAVMSAAGQLNMDAARFQQQTLRGEQLFTQSDLNHFVETATDAQKRDVGERLGISDWSTVTADELKSRIVEFSTNGGLDQYINERNQVKDLTKLEISKKGLPKYVGSIKQDGAVRYRFGDASVAIIKNGNTYQVYDYANDVISKPLNKTEANRVIKEIYAASTVSATDSDVQAVTQSQQQTQELDTFARENVPDYKNITGAQQQAVRQTLRQARAAGIAEADQILYASVAARSGVNIEFVSAETLGANADAGYSLKSGKILVNREMASNPKARTAAKIILHEFTHGMINGGYVVTGRKGKKHIENRVLNDFFNTAIKGLSVEQQVEILTPYVERHNISMQDFLDGKVDITVDTFLELREELAANFVERELGSSEALKRIISDKPSFKDKLLSFLKRSKSDYSSNEKLSRAANSLLKKYQKFFNQFATQGRYSPNIQSDLSVYQNTEANTDAQTRLSIKKINGRDVVVVDTDQNIFDGVERADLGKTVRSYMKERYRGRTINGVDFTSQSEREFTYSRDSQRLYNQQNGAYEAKMRVSAELDNLILTGEFMARETAKHPRTINEGGVSRYKVSFVLENTVFNGEMLVAIDKNGVGTFYDIVKIKESESSNIAPNGEVRTNAPSTDSISNPEGNVNQNGKKGGKKRYALTVDGENIAGEVEETRNLVALHNLTEDKLLKVLQLGGFPMPSIAVTKTDIPFTDFGDITVVFSRETIDPANPANRVYSRDAWTPTVPRAEYRINETVAQEIIERLTPYVDEYGAQSGIRRFLTIDALQDLLNATDGDVISEIKGNRETQYAFLRDIGVISREDTDMVPSFSEKITGKINSEIAARGEAYNAWLNDLFDDLTDKKGVRNRTSEFAPSGARRSFEETHYEYTLENIVNVMRSYAAQGAETDYASAHTLAAALAKSFSSIEDIKQAENLLSVKNSKEIHAAINEYEHLISEIVDSMAGRDIQLQTGAEAVLMEMARSKRITAESILSYLQKEYKGIYNFNAETAQKISALFNALSSMKTDMFEAKPRRAVGLNEIKQVLIPSRYPNQKLLQALQERNIPYTLYQRSIDNHIDERAKIIRRMDDVRFALSETDSQGRTLTEQQRAFFEGTRVVDAQGRLLVVYHGSPYVFTEFLAEKMSMHGSSEGQGFYFTDAKSMAEGYSKKGGQLLEGYLSIKKPLSDSDITITRKQVETLLRTVDPTGDDVIINYAPDDNGYGKAGHKQWYERGLRATLNSLFEYSSSDSEILAEIANAGAGTEAVLNAAYKKLGFDGYIVSDKYEGASVFVAFDSSQFKNATNNAPTASRDIRYALPNTDSDARTLTAEQRKYFKDSKFTDQNGHLLTLYHQTAADFTVFDTSIKGTGQHDYLTPFGIFMKPSAKNIGIKGDIQMALYGNVTNPIEFADRAALESYLRDVGFGKELDGIKNLDAEYQAKSDKAEKRFMELAQKAYDNPKNKILQNQLSIAETEWSDIIDEWGTAFDKRSAALKELVNKHFRNTEYDGIILRKDGGSFGRETAAYIAFEPNQVKSVSNTKPTSSNDIRFALSGDEFQARLIAAQDMRNEARGYNRKIKINSDGSVLLYHGTSAENAQSIRETGIIKAQSYFTTRASEAYYYANQKNKNGVILEIHADARALEFAAAGAEIYSPIELKKVDGVYTSDNVRYALAETDATGKKLSEQQRSFFKDSKIVDEQGRLLPVYHGSPKAGFTTFNTELEGSYFTANEQYAQEYARGDKSKVYAVYLNITKPFDTRNADARLIFEKEFYGQWGNGSPLTERGLLDWTDGVDMFDFLHEKGYDYDGIIIDEGGVPDGKGGVRDRGISYVAFSPEQIKLVANKNPSTNTDIRYALDPTESDNSGAIGGMTRGQRAKFVANNTKFKVYSKLEATSVIDSIIAERLVFDDGRFEGVLDSKSRAEVIEKLFIKLNSTPEGYRIGVALDIADYIINNAVLSDMYETFNDDSYAMGVLSVIRSYMHRMDLRGIQGEIQYKFDKKNTINLVWGAKTGGISPDVVAQELQGYGIEIKAINEAEQFFEMLEIYEKAREQVNKRAEKVMLTAYGNQTEIEQVRQQIARDVLLAYDKNGTQSKFGKLVEQYTKKIADLKRDLSTAYKRNTLTNRIIDGAAYLRDIATKRNYVGAEIFSAPELTSWLKQLSKIKYRSDLRKSGVRKILLDYGQFYNTNNVLLYDENPDLSYIDSNVIDALNLIRQNALSSKPLSMEELQAAEVIIASAKHLFNTYDQVIIEGKKAQVSQLAAEGNEIIKKSKNRTSKTFFNKIYGVFNKIIEPRVVIKSLENYHPNGILTRAYAEITRGETEASLLYIEMTNDIDTYLKRHKRYSKRLASEYIKVGDAELTIGQAISLYELSKRVQAQEGLYESGFSYIDKKGSKQTAHITEADILALADAFTDTDRGFIELVETFFNVTSKQVKTDADMQILGYTNASDEFYYPIKRDSGTIAKNITDARSIMADWANVYNFSFNKDVKTGAKNKLFVTDVYSIVTRHAKQLSTYARMTVPLKNFSQIYAKNIGDKTNVVSIRNTINEQVWGGAESYLSKLFADIQGRATSDSLIEKMRGAYAKYQLGANLKVIVSQVTSYPTAGILLDASSLAKGFVMKTDWAALDKYAPYARVRNYERGIVKAEGVIDKIGKVGDVLTKPIQWTDRFTIGRLWNAAQLQIQKDTGLRFGTVENMQKAGVLLEDVIRMTQPNYTNTERSELMRSDSDIVRSFTMFTSVPLKQLSRLIESFGEYNAIRSLIKSGDTDTTLPQRYKLAKRKLRRTLASVTVANLMYVLVAQFFKFLYNNMAEDDEEGKVTAKSVFLDMLKDFGSTTIGMFPVVRDIYSYFVDGYEINSFTADMLNSIIGSAKSLFELAQKAAAGEEISTQTIMSVFRNSLYSIGQITGIPFRNINNTLTGLVKRFSPSAAYSYTSLFYNPKYSSDIKAALKKGDYDLAETIMGMMLKDDKTGGLSSKATRKLIELYDAGYTVLPKSIGDTLTYNGEEIQLTAAQKKAFKEIYSQANAEIEKLINSAEFATLSAERQAKAIKLLYDAYYSKAQAVVLNVATDNKIITLSSAFPPPTLAVYLSAISAIESDTDRKGNVINGSKKAKVIKYVLAQRLSTAQKLLLILSLGYTIKDGDIRGVTAARAKNIVARYITNLSLTREEKTALAEKCGLTVRNGRIYAK